MDGGRCYAIFLVITFYCTFALGNSIPVPSRFAYDDNSTTTDILNHLKRNARYTKERPGEATGRPDKVNVSMHITSIRAISEADSEISYDMYYRYTWRDERLKYDGGPPYVIVDVDLARNYFWFPDLFFVNAHQTSVQTTGTPNTAVRFKQDGTFLVSAQITLKAHCDMDLSKFPHDTQRCGFGIESYMYLENQVSLEIKENSVSTQATHPVFSFGEPRIRKMLQVLSSGSYSHISVEFKMKRSSAHYIAFLYLPTILLVCLSCLVFWLPPAALMERTIYSVFLLFCLVPILVGSQYGAPVVGYLKAIDVWMISCFFFMAVAVFEVILLHLIFGRDLLAKGQTGDQFELMRDEGSNKNVSIVKIGPVVIQPDVARKIDLAFRIIYPAAFVLFNGIYWGATAR